MPKLKSFTLVELLVVIFIISLVYMVSIKFFVPKQVEIKDLYLNLYPNGSFNLNKFNCKRFNYYDNELQKEDNPIYRVKNGIGDSFLLVCNRKIYLFRPFDIKVFKNKQNALESMSKYLNEGID